MTTLADWLNSLPARGPSKLSNIFWSNEFKHESPCITKKTVWLMECYCATRWPRWRHSNRITGTKTTFKRTKPTIMARKKLLFSIRNGQNARKGTNRPVFSLFRAIITRQRPQKGHKKEEWCAQVNRRWHILMYLRCGSKLIDSSV